MPLADYAKFYEMLLNNGVGPATGERVLSPLGAEKRLFELFLCYIQSRNHFAKIGSGQTDLESENAEDKWCCVQVCRCCARGGCRG